MNLHELIEELKRIFSSDDVDVEEVMKTMESYKSNIADWSKFAVFDDFKYTRNLVDVGNGKYNLMVLCWPPGLASSVHDHTDAHCFVKILHGKLLETKYDWPKETNEPLQKIEETIYDCNGVSYMCDKLGLHRMENPSHSEGAVSMHLYIPPYESCNAFDERSGKKTKCKVTFHSKYGKLVDYRNNRDGQVVNN